MFLIGFVIAFIGIWLAKSYGCFFKLIGWALVLLGLVIISNA